MGCKKGIRSPYAVPYPGPRNGTTRRAIAHIKGMALKPASVLKRYSPWEFRDRLGKFGLIARCVVGRLYAYAFISSNPVLTQFY